MINTFTEHIDKAISSSTIVLSSNIQKHFSPDGKTLYLKGSLIFLDSSVLEIALFVIETHDALTIEKYRFHPTDKQFKKFVQVQTYNSYYLKHFVEKWSGKYISNGAFIAAVRFMGLPFRPIYGTPDVSVTVFLKEEATLL